MKRYRKKINHDDVMDVMDYLYLSNRYSTLLNIHKNDDSVSSELKIQWADKYIENLIKYNIKSLEIFKENNIPINLLARHEFSLEDDLLEYCLKESSEC